MSWSVYSLTIVGKKKPFYIGAAMNPTERVRGHKSVGYVGKHIAKRPVYVEILGTFETRNQAMNREAIIILNTKGLINRQYNTGITTKKVKTVQGLLNRRKALKAAQMRRYRANLKKRTRSVERPNSLIHKGKDQ